jgi:ribosomal protein S21
VSDYYNSSETPMARPITVTVRYTGDSKEERDQSLEKALSQLKKIMTKEGLMNEIKERQYYQSDGRKRYLQRQKFYYRLDQKKEKDSRYGKKTVSDDKNHSYKGVKSNYGHRDQPKRPNTNNR